MLGGVAVFIIYVATLVLDNAGFIAASQAVIENDLAVVLAVALGYAETIDRLSAGRKRSFRDSG